MNWKFLGGTSLLLFALYFFGGILQAVLFIPSIADWIAPLGVGKYFAYAIAVPLFFWLNFAIGKLFSFRKMSRRIGLFMLLGLFGAMSLMLGVKSHGDRFDQETGTPMKSYTRDALSGQIRIFPSGTKFDPETGQKTLPLTPEVVGEMESMRRESWTNGGLREMGDMYRTIPK